MDPNPWPPVVACLHFKDGREELRAMGHLFVPVLVIPKPQSPVAPGPAAELARITAIEYLEGRFRLGQQDPNYPRVWHYHEQ